MVAVIRPPIAGPMMAEIPHTLLNRPCIRARCRGSKMSPTMVKAMGWTAPAPRPWIARKTISWSIDWLRPQSAEPPTKSPRPARKIGLRPCVSASVEKTGTKTFDYHDSAKSVVAPHGFSVVIIQACIAILILVGFESVTAMGRLSAS